jgi:hypothetical protein
MNTVADKTLTMALSQVLDLQKSWSKDNTPAMQERGRLVRDEIPQLLRESLDALDTEGWEVEGRDGSGLKTSVPWVRIFDSVKSPSATQGWYVVFLFAADGSSVYLSLNQGTTEFKGGAFVPRDVSDISDRVTSARSALTGQRLSTRLLTEIQLKDGGKLGAGYERGNVYAYGYKRGALPSDDELRSDLATMLNLLLLVDTSSDAGDGVDFTINGQLFRFSRQDVVDAFAQTHKDQWESLAGADPRWQVTVGGESKPLKAVFRNMHGVPANFDFNTHKAKAVFVRLGFAVHEIGAHADEIALVGTSRSVEDYITDAAKFIAERGGWASWWSFALRPDAAATLAGRSFYLYINSGGGKLPYRVKVSDFVTSSGYEGVESPWPEITEDHLQGQRRQGEKQSEVYKTWFKVIAIEKLEPTWTLSERFSPYPGMSNDLNVLNQNAFGYLKPKNSTVIQPGIGKRYSIADCVAETGLSEKEVNRLLRLLRRKKQIVLQGPPGTGKTYIAERLARVLAEENAGILQTVQFHASYAYEDFVYGLRPVAKNDTLLFKGTPGIFMDFCSRASTLAPGSSAVLVIDEINRANLSRVLGELMYLLEYRGKSLQIPGSQTPFTIPANVYLIGTMNTADRSIAVVDHALRRRFGFAFIAPDYETLRSYLTKHSLPATSLITTLQRINQLIEDRNYQIGISFFMSDGTALPATLPDVWQSEIEPYLEEYFFDQPERIESMRWDALRKSDLKEWVSDSN